MSNLWRMDSPFMQKMTAVTNLLLLNLLWLVCSIPIVTMGAATTAMYSVLFDWRRDITDSVVKPFFTAFRKSFGRSTLCWVVLLILGIALCYDVIWLIFGAEMQLFLCIPVILVGLMVLITGAYIFPQLALFDNKLMPSIKNGFLLFILNPLQSLAVIVLNWLPWILLLCFPQLFWSTLPVWVLIGISLCARISSYLLFKIFDKYIPKTD